MRSKTRLKHTCPTEEPFECMTGDLSDQGFLVVVDKRTHELLIPKEQETDETLTVLVNPRVALTVERGDAAEWQAGESRRFPLSPERRQASAAPDYLTAALSRLRAAAVGVGFDVREVTLRFNEYDQTVELEARLVITADLLDLAPEQHGAIGAPRAQNQKVLSGSEN